MGNKIFVTQPFLPPLEEFNEYLKKIWKSKWLTNNGPFHMELEQMLCEYMGVKHISLFSNGTLALITAIQAMKISGEVITTPYSFVATTHALWWNNIKPVFADIDPVTFNLDPDKVEAAITPKTTAILPVHVYGNPCNVIKLQKIADRYGLKLIYDAAHSFGVKIKGTSLATYGDLAILSFHATKVFNTFEGGAIICHDEITKQHIDQLKNFGIINETTVLTPGINAKMNEFQSALGILQLKYLDEAIGKRKFITERYRELLEEIPGLTIMKDVPGVEYNFAYFPILIDYVKFERTRDEVYNKLKSHNIFSRRYFYPLISQFPTYKGLPSADPANLPIAEKITQQILCLPIYPDLEINNVERVCDLVIG
jgi:dTDP-4-amino-4,6-dideoxygalactose transaminase